MTATNVPLTLSQRDILFDQLTQLESPIYNIGGYITCRNIDISKLQEAHKKLAMHHDVFGLRIVEEGNDVSQYVSGDRDTTLTHIDFCGFDEPEQEANKWLDKLFQTVIPFFNSQLCFGYLLQVNSEEFWYVGIGHHLAIDGWGFLNWSYKLAEFYNSEQPQEYQGLSYSEMSQADQDYLRTKRFQQDKEFWKNQNILSEQRLFSAQYIDEHTKSVNQAVSTRFRKPICRKWFEQCTQLCEQHRTGVPQFLMAVMSYYFSSVANLKHIVLGVPAHNRKNYKQKKTIGVFTTMTPLSIELQSKETFASLLSQIGTYQRTCLRHQKFPNSNIARLFSTDQPFYDLSFNYLKLDYHALRFGQNDTNVVYQTSGREKIPLTITVWDGGNENLELQLDFNHAYFSDADIQKLGERFDYLLSFFNDDKNWQLPLNQCPLIRPDEQTELNELYRSTKTTLSGSLIHEFLENTAERIPNAIALRDSHRSLSYLELNETANRLAHFLAESKGSAKEKIVGICQTRSVDMVISILGVLKAGMAYVPLDPQYPKERLNMILSDAQPHLILCHSNTSNLVESLGYKTCEIDGIHSLAESHFAHYPSSNISRVATKLSGENLAYLIYTSGSTGKPKGVAIEHRNTSAMIDWAVDTFSSETLSHVLVSTSLNFDLSIFEMFVPLAVGGCGTIVENVLALTKDFNHITLVNTVPSAIEGLLEANSVPDSVQVINLAGEPLPSAIVNDIFAKTPASKVFNLYGPSEDTTYSTFAEFTQSVTKEPHIGKVIANSQAYVLNSDLQVLPKGTVGELYLGGAGVARGYLNKSELTSERFIPANLIASENKAQNGKIYRTGDLVKINEEGYLEYLGRIDDQVKIRGHRIELAEVKTHLLSLPKVKSCLVVSKRIADSLQLVAYCQSSSNETGAAVSSGELKAQLSQTLPEYMVPNFYMWLTKWPLTPNGKIDKSKLPLPRCCSNIKLYIQPETNTEQKLALAWANLLEVEVSKISADADFFELGGHSILAMRLASAISEVFQAEVGVTAIFTHSNLRKLASFIDSTSTYELLPEIIPVVGTQEHFLVSSAQQGLWLLDNIQDGSREYNMAQAFTVSGYLELESLRNTIKSLVERHPILRTVYKELDNEVVQVIQAMDQIDFSILKKDLSEFRGETQRDNIRHCVAELNNARFDLAKDLMIKVAFLKLSEDEAILHFNIHHIAADGWSIEVLINEMVNLYEAKLSGKDSKLAPLTLQYADFAQWQRKHFCEDKLEKQLSYWQGQLANMPLEHGLPTLHTGSVERSHAAHRVCASLPSECVAPIIAFASEKKLTPFMLVHGALAIVLARYSNRSDIVIGTPISLRPHKELETVMGFFINTLVLRVQTGNVTVDEFLSHVKATSIAAHNNKEFPFESLFEQLNMPRAQKYSPLFQIMLTTSNDYGINETQSLQQLSLGNATLEPYEPDERHIKFELEISVAISPQEIVITSDYDHNIFEQNTIQNICNDTLNILNELVEKQQELNTILIHQLEVISCDHQVRYLPDGELEFLGHLDDQIKSRSLHAVLEEIQTHITKHPQIDSCVVALKKSAARELLVAYCQLTEDAIEADSLFDELRFMLKASLPEYMIPSSFVSISDWPLTRNGKIDELSLPSPKCSPSIHTYVAPESETEAALTKICADLLNIPTKEISTTSNFFELGGHSLMLLKLKARIEAHFSLSLTFKDVAEEATIQSISSLVDMETMRSRLEDSSNVPDDEVEVMDW